MREKFRCAKIDDDLYDVLSDPDSRREIENLLVSKYLTCEPPHDRKSSVVAMIGMALCLVA